MSKYNDLSDDELVSLLREGNRNAFTAIYDRYFWLLHSHAYKWLRNREEAGDIIHELFLRLWEKRDTLSPEGGLPGYLYASVRNRIFNLIAHNRVKSEYLTSLQDFTHHGECITDHPVREKLLAELIEREIAGMPRRMREIFELSRKQLLSHREISRELNISEQTVRKHIQHALRILRVSLGLHFLFLFLFVPPLSF